MADTPKNKGGRPKGSKDKKWAHIQTFWELLITEYPNLKPAQRAYYAFEGFKLHFERAISHLPADQSESLANAIAAQVQLKKLEEDARLGTKTASD